MRWVPKSWAVMLAVRQVRMITGSMILRLIGSEGPRLKSWALTTLATALITITACGKTKS